MENITSILQWLIPSGGLGAIVVWLFSKTLRQIRTTKEVHDTYKHLYENIQGTLLDLQDENKKLYKAVSKLERAISRASTCRYFDACPIRDELHGEQKSDAKTGSRKRQCSDQGDQESRIRADPDVEREPPDTG